MWRSISVDMLYVHQSQGQKHGPYRLVITSRRERTAKIVLESVSAVCVDQSISEVSDKRFNHHGIHFRIHSLQG